MIYEEYYRGAGLGEGEEEDEERKFLVLWVKRGWETKLVAVLVEGDLSRMFRRRRGLEEGDAEKENLVRCGLLELPMTCKQM